MTNTRESQNLFASDVKPKTVKNSDGVTTIWEDGFSELTIQHSPAGTYVCAYDDALGVHGELVTGDKAEAESFYYNWRLSFFRIQQLDD
jgi:hypothetical protein